MIREKATGPATAACKAVVSNNALRHGATATRLLTPEEKQRYESLLAALKLEFTSKNPLIQLQLERIAKLTVQLERTQMIMDAEHLKSRRQADVIDIIMNKIEFNEEQTRLFCQIFGEAESAERLFNTTHKKLEYEIFMINFEDLHINNHDALLANAPNLCRALYEKAYISGLSIEHFLTQNLTQQNEKLRKENMELDEVDLNNKLNDQKLVYQEIKKTNFAELLNAVDYYKVKYINELNIKIKSSKLKNLIEPERESIMPNLDQMDKLMRYQTTFQRQLSTCIGELLQLTKN